MSAGGPPVLFAGGGTGGHLYPGLAVLEALRARNRSVAALFAGSGRDVERRILAAEAVEHVALAPESTSALWRRPWRFFTRNRAALRDARVLLRERRPGVVVGLGGFASVPAVVAAWRLRTPIVLLEQNVVPGRATAWLSRLADRICVSFSETIGWLPRSARPRAIVTGNPVRRVIAELASRPAPIGPRRTILVLGGSLGASPVNTALLAVAERLTDRLKGWSILHQSGPAELHRVAECYRSLGLDFQTAAYFDDMPERLASATFAISRAGATTLAELACAGCPAILIPFAGAARDHQRHNAAAFTKSAGAAMVFESHDRSKMDDELAQTVSRWLDDAESTDATAMRNRRDAMRQLAQPGAAHAVADQILEISRRDASR